MGVKKVNDEKIIKLYNSGLTYAEMASSERVNVRTIDYSLCRLRKEGKITGYRSQYIQMANKSANRPFKKPKQNTTLSWKPREKLKDLPWKYISETGKTIVDLKQHDCRWPCKDGLFCGRVSATGKSYCEEHQRISEGK